jgi:hypothetical protein
MPFGLFLDKKGKVFRETKFQSQPEETSSSEDSTLANLLSAGVCLAIFVVALILGLRWLWRALGASGHERLTAFIGSFMGFAFAYAYFVWGLRILTDAVVANALPYLLQWGVAFGLAGFFELLWALRLTYHSWISKKKWLYFLPLIATGIYMGLFIYSVFYAVTPITLGYVGDFAPMVGISDTTHMIGSALCWVAGFDLIVYMGIVPLWVFLRTQKGGFMALKNLLPYLGILLLFIGGLLELILHIFPIDIAIIAGRALIAVAIVLLWFK